MSSLHLMLDKPSMAIMSFNHNFSAGYLANHMARLFFEQLRIEIEHLGIVPGQFPALLALWQRDGQTQKELVNLTGVEQATMANTLNRMERDGLISRRNHPKDGRAKVIFLTRKSLGVRDEAYAAATKVNEKALADLTKEERDQFINYMQRTVATLKEL